MEQFPSEGISLFSCSGKAQNRAVLGLVVRLWQWELEGCCGGGLCVFRALK